MLCVWFCLAVSVSSVCSEVKCTYDVVDDFSVCFVVVLLRVFVCFCCLCADVFCSSSNTYQM